MTAANLILENARVRTLDEARPSAEAVAIADGMVVAVGDRQDVADWRGASPEVIDLQGAAVLPGLVDSHQHPFLGTQEARGVDLAGVRTLDGVLAALRKERLRCNDGEWVHGFALAYEVSGASRFMRDRRRLMAPATRGAARAQCSHNRGLPVC